MAKPTVDVVSSMPTDGESVTIVGEPGHGYIAAGRAVPGPGVDLEKLAALAKPDPHWVVYTKAIFPYWNRGMPLTIGYGFGRVLHRSVSRGTLV